ncbi:MAG: ribonuclease HI [Clostridia bacterium]|nr:ribonuclease HI [Clostridia bacterium]
MKDVEIFTDGACLGNPGPGGWGAILRYNGIEKHLSGGQADTTNNRMEILAVISALQALKEKCNVMLYTDSQYVCNAINEGWAKKWQSNNWERAKNKPASNADLWEVLLNLLEKQNVTFNWIKGHAGHSENEKCDILAKSEAKKYM